MSAIIPRTRFNLLTKIRCNIFQTSYNPTSVRTGAKYLKARLRGPSMVNYYPDELTVGLFNRMNKGEWKIQDPDEIQRFQDIADRKKRGKGAPKKAKTAADSRRTQRKR